MSIIQRIRANLDQMSPADRQIGHFIAENPEVMLGLSSSALADATGRSQSSVIKFAQKLGFSSYQDLKLAVSSNRALERHAGNGPIHGEIEQGDSLSTLYDKLLASKYRAISETLHANAESDMLHAVEAICTARKIYLTGVGASSLVASDLAFKLLKIGRTVLQNSDPYVQIANAAGMSPDDTMVAISHSGYSLDTLRIAELAKSRGARLVAMTGVRNNPLANIADILLYTVADEEQARSSAITARDAQLALTDLLFLKVVQEQDDALQYIEQSRAAVAVLKTN